MYVWVSKLLFFLVCGISKFNFLYVDVQKMQNFVGFSKKHFHVSGGLENSVFCVCGLENAIFVCGDLEKYFYVEVLENSISGIWGLENAFLVCGGIKNDMSTVPHVHWG